MTTEELDNLARLEQAAHPAPWECREHEGLSAIAWKSGWVGEDDDQEMDNRDNRLIVALRNALPDLLRLARERDVLLAVARAAAAWNETNFARWFEARNAVSAAEIRLDLALAAARPILDSEAGKTGGK